MIALSLACQSAIAYFRRRHQGTLAVAKEVAIVFTFLKPVADLRRLSAGHEIDGAPCDTATERSYCAGAEMVAESLPSAFLQVAVALSTGQLPPAVVASIMFSWGSTAYKTYSIALNQDTDLQLRRFYPSFYGYVPKRPSRRLLVSALLFVLCLAHIVGKTSAMALLFVTNRAYLFSYVAVDMGVYLLYKIVRGDFYCWVPDTGVRTAVAYRVATKLMLDFTGLPQLRNPCDLGGMCWAATMATTQVTCLISAFLYSQEFEGDVHVKLVYSSLMGTMGTLACVWALAIVCLLLTMEREYIRTFFSFQTGSEYAAAAFLSSRDSGDDEGCFQIFAYNELLWTRILPDVQSYLQENLPRLVEEKPEWLTAGLIGSVRDHVLPEGCDVTPLRTSRTSVHTARTSVHTSRASVHKT
jgi:hypothetical protein